MSRISCVIHTLSSKQEIEPADMILLPGAKGELGVLYNHAPTIVELKEGFIRTYKDEALANEVKIEGGIAYIKADIIEIFSTPRFIF